MVELEAGGRREGGGEGGSRREAGRSWKLGPEPIAGTARCRCPLLPLIYSLTHSFTQHTLSEPHSVARKLGQSLCYSRLLEISSERALNGARLHRRTLQPVGKEIIVGAPPRAAAGKVVGEDSRWARCPACSVPPSTCRAVLGSQSFCLKHLPPWPLPAASPPRGRPEDLHPTPLQAASHFCCLSLAAPAPGRSAVRVLLHGDAQSTFIAALGSRSCSKGKPRPRAPQ